MSSGYSSDNRGVRAAARCRRASLGSPRRFSLLGPPSRSRSSAVSRSAFWARHAGAWPDHLVAGGALVSQGLPTFWVGIVLLLLFARIFQILPSSAAGAVDPSSLVLPAFTLALPFLGWLARLVRTGILEEANQEYVTTARAKGLSERAVFYIHIMRNASIPILTVLGLLTGNFVANAVIVETVFAWPGIGRLMLSAILYRDYAVVSAGVFIIVILYVALNFTVDLLYFWADPTIRRDYA